MATTRGASFQKLPPVVGFIDMDCFYVAVERARDPRLRGKPCAVVQYPTGERGRPDLPPEADRWRTGGAMGGIIAVSYEARAKGVTRTMSGADARKACPEIILVQVPTAFGKADLRIYKEAGDSVVEVLSHRCDATEKRSVDEVAIDLTSEAERLLATRSFEEDLGPAAARIAHLADSALSRRAANAVSSKVVIPNPHQRLQDMAIGGASVGLIALLTCLVTRKERKAGETPLKEPLLTADEDPELVLADQEGNEASIEAWKQKALAAVQSSQKAKAEIAQLNAQAEQQKSIFADQVAAVEQRLSQAEQDAAAKSAEAERTAQELAKLQEQVFQVNSDSSSVVAEYERKRQELNRTQTDLATAKYQLELSQAALQRLQLESQSAQKAAQDAQVAKDEAVAKLDPSNVVSQQRVEEAEGKVSKLNEDLESARKETSSVKEQLGVTTGDLASTKSDLEAARKEASTAQAQLATTASDLAATKSELDSTKAELSTAKSEATTTADALASTKADLASSQEQATALSASVAEKEAQISSLQSELAKAQEEHEGTKAGLESSKKDAETAHAEKHSAKQEMEAVKAEHEAAKEELAKHKAELSEAKAAALDASQVLESIRSQAGSELAETKKTIEELQDVVKMHEATIGLKDEEIEAEKSRANLAETIAQTRQGEVEMAQKLAEKAKAALQSVRQELTAECSAAKAQVEVERNLAIEAEENAEKFRLEAQKARQAEQQAKIAEQEALLKLRKAGGSPTGTESPTASPRGLPEIGDDPQLVELKKQLAAQKEEAEKAKDELEKLRALQEPAKQEEVFPEAVKEPVAPAAVLEEEMGLPGAVN